MTNDSERPIERRANADTGADTGTDTDAVARAGIPEGAAPHTTADDVSELAGVGGAMRGDDEHPHLIGEVDAGEIYLPIMEADAGEVPSADESAEDAIDAEGARPPGAEPGAQL